MNMNVTTILVLVAAGLSVVALIKPSWPLTPVAVLLVCVAILTMGK